MTFSNKRVGGLRFIRVGRLSLSFCLCRAEGASKPRRARSTAVATIPPRLRSVVLPGGQRALIVA